MFVYMYVISEATRNPLRGHNFQTFQEEHAPRSPSLSTLSHGIIPPADEKSCIKPCSGHHSVVLAQKLAMLLKLFGLWMNLSSTSCLQFDKS